MGLSHNPGHRASREVVGPHRGPYRSRPYRRVRCADQAPLAEVMIKAAWAAQFGKQPPAATLRSHGAKGTSWRPIWKTATWTQYRGPSLLSRLGPLCGDPEQNAACRRTRPVCRFVYRRAGCGAGGFWLTGTVLCRVLPRLLGLGLHLPFRPCGSDRLGGVRRLGSRGRFH